MRAEGKLSGVPSVSAASPATATTATPAATTTAVSTTPAPATASVITLLQRRSRLRVKYDYDAQDVLDASVVVAALPQWAKSGVRMPRADTLVQRSDRPMRSAGRVSAPATTESEAATASPTKPVAATTQATRDAAGAAEPATTRVRRRPRLLADGLRAVALVRQPHTGPTPCVAWTWL